MQKQLLIPDNGNEWVKKMHFVQSGTDNLARQNIKPHHILRLSKRMRYKNKCLFAEQ